MLFDDMEEFADYMPEGIKLNKVQSPLALDCLCAVDMDDTAKENGYRCERRNDGRFAFILEDVE